IELELPGINIESISTGENASKFDLTLYLTEQEDGLKLKLVYNADLFVAERMVEMLNQYHYLLTQIVENPQVDINDLSIVTQSAKSFLPNPEQQLSGKWEGTIYNQFSQQVQRVPQHLAVVDAQVAWTYDELEKRANQLANYLIGNKIKQQDIVAIYAQRSASLVWAILGVLKAGAAFVILDPAYPTSRLIDCLQIVQPCAWLQIAEELPTDLKEYVDSLSCDCQLNIPDSTLVITDLLQDYSTDTPEVTIEPDNLAYIAFTSGSTGKPKGIKGTHRPLSHFVQWHCQNFGLNQSDRFSMLCGLSHDPLLRDIFTPLSLGATLYIPKQEDIYSPSKLTDWMLERQITIAHLTPAMAQMLSADTKTTTKYLRYLFFGGDVLTKQDVEGITKFAPNAKSINFYGSTETPQAMGYFIIPHNYVLSKDTVPLGQGIDDVQLLLINSKQQLAGIGE
ncbi:MAG: AMP-binding protein, partial [Cyanobacteria bacterium J06649_11]